MLDYLKPCSAVSRSPFAKIKKARNHILNIFLFKSRRKHACYFSLFTSQWSVYLVTMSSAWKSWGIYKTDKPEKRVWLLLAIDRPQRIACVHPISLRYSSNDLVSPWTHTRTPYPYERLRKTEPACHLEIYEVTVGASSSTGTSPPTECVSPEILK